MKLDARLVLRLPETADPVSGYAGGYEAARSLIAGGHEFTGVLAFDDLTACGVIRGLEEAGLHVPKDISVVGFDDIPQAVLTMPSLTTVSQHTREMGRSATEHILALIEGKASSRSSKSFIRLHPPTLIARESSAKVHRGPRRKR